MIADKHIIEAFGAVHAALTSFDYGDVGVSDSGDTAFGWKCNEQRLCDACEKLDALLEAMKSEVR